MGAIQAQNTTLSVSSDGGNTYLEVGCIQALGDIDFGSKEVTTIDCLNNENIDKVLGTLKLGALDLSYTYDPLEPAGNGVIKSAFDASVTTAIDVMIELNNSGGTNGTQFKFKAIVPFYKITGIDKNDFVKTSVSLEQTTKPTVVAAA